MRVSGMQLQREAFHSWLHILPSVGQLGVLVVS